MKDAMQWRNYYRDRVLGVVPTAKVTILVRGGVPYYAVHESGDPRANRLSPWVASIEEAWRLAERRVTAKQKGRQKEPE